MQSELTALSEFTKLGFGTMVAVFGVLVVLIYYLTNKNAARTTLALTDAVGSAMSQVTSLSAKNSELLERLGRNLETDRELRQELIESNRRLSDLQERFIDTVERLTDGFGQILDGMSSQSEEFREKYNIISSQFKSVCEALSQVRTGQSSVEKDMIALKDLVSDIQGDVAKLELAIRDELQTRSNAASRIDALITAHDKIQATLQTLSQRIELLNERIKRGTDEMKATKPDTDNTNANSSES